MSLDRSQQAAVDNIAMLDSRIYLLIGAGGAGKTFTIKHLLVKLWENPGNDVTDETTYLAAPTGKASKVLADSFAQSGFEIHNEPRTIHRLLEYNPKLGWGHNEDCKLNASLVVLDEASMIGSMLLHRLISALPDGCVLILVGDDEQLAPVEAGQPFVDFINHGTDRIVNRLTTNHRQAQGSLIATACLAVRDGNMPQWGTPGKHTLGGVLEDDLFFNEQDDKENIPEIVVGLCRPWHEQQLDYTVLAPQRTGVCGVDALNKYLQEELNPAVEGKPQIKLGWLTLRLGDKVVQTKNDYNWGVFNGFTGRVVAVDAENETLVVDFDGQLVNYEKGDDIKKLALGYCLTIHKSQGSQWQYGIVVCHSSHYYMQSRNLFYTGISRFRQELHVVGDKRAVKRAVSNVVSGERQTLLKLKLVEGKEVEA